MKLMSFNTQHCLNYLEQKVDYEIMARAIEECGADIVGLNEMFDEAEGAKFGAQTARLSELTSLKNHFFAKAIDDFEGPYGNGLLTKYKIESAESIIIPDPCPREYPGGFYETRCLLKARLENGLTVIVTHFGLNPDEQENAVKTIVENMAPRKCIVMGDFNMEPDNPILNPIMQGLQDTAKFFSTYKLSFPSDTPKVKIDYIFVSKDLKVEYADIPEIISSDHRPHVATIELE